MVCGLCAVHHGEVHAHASWEVFPINDLVAQGESIAERCPRVGKMGLTGVGLVNCHTEEVKFLLSLVFLIISNF